MFHDQHCNHSCARNANHSCMPICDDGYMKESTLAERIREIRIAAGDSPTDAGKKGVFGFSG